jgi:hypothetical protein
MLLLLSLLVHTPRDQSPCVAWAPRGDTDASAPDLLVVNTTWGTHSLVSPRENLNKTAKQ